MINTGQEAVDNGITIVNFCNSVGVPSRSYFSWKKASDKNEEKKKGRKIAPINKLTSKEKKEVVNVLLKREWVDFSPREIYYKLIDEEKRIIASPATFYRVAKEADLLTKRIKTGAKRPLNREKPCLVATGINQVWSWDVSQIKSDCRTQRFYLYVIIDIWSRLVVGWTLEDHEKSELAIKMWKKALEDQFITGKGLTNHKDNGAIMTSDEMIKFVRDANMVDSYSRAGVSDDNPFSESLFGTIKTFRTFPGSFSGLQIGREYFKSYFCDYNYSYKHSGIQFITPAERHYGEEIKILDSRNQTIDSFYKTHSHRYTKGAKKFSPIVEVTIN